MTLKKRNQGYSHFLRYLKHRKAPLNDLQQGNITLEKVSGQCSTFCVVHRRFSLVLFSVLRIPAQLQAIASVDIKRVASIQ
jgi:hypothetical protein